MKNTVKLFGLIALAALIVFAACDNNTDPGNTDITWSASADGAASTADSTKITFTFSGNVSGLTTNDIALTPLTVSITKGTLSGSGTSYTLNITVKNQGYISVAIKREGVAADAQQVQVFKKAVNPISAGVITYINDGEQVVFSGNGKYTLKSQNRDDQTWEPKADGSYDWNSNAQTLTLTPTHVADNDGVMTAKASAMPLFVDWVKGEIDDEIEARMAWSGETHAKTETAVLESRNEENGTAFTTLQELINYLADIRFNETFTVHSYTYIFSNDDESLILLEELPAPTGTDELAGKTFDGTISDWITGDSRRNSDHKFVFSAAGRTYIEIGSDGSTTSTGYYSYDSTAKRVYLKRMTREGKTPEQYYVTTDYYEEFDRYPSEADSRTSQTHQHFRLLRYGYDPAQSVIDSKDSGEIEGL